MGKVTQNKRHNHNNKPKVLSSAFFLKKGLETFRNDLLTQQEDLNNYPMNHEIDCDCYSCLIQKKHFSQFLS